MCNYITPYQERQRDRPCEAQQPLHKLLETVLNPTNKDVREMRLVN